MKILIVDDEFSCRVLLQEMLNSYGTCHTATNGQEAVKAFTSMLDQKSTYDLICLDIMMPKMNGQEALKKIRNIEKERGIGDADSVKIIMTTCVVDPKNIMTAFINGPCEAYMIKPILPDQLKEQITKLGLDRKNELEDNDK